MKCPDCDFDMVVNDISFSDDDCYKYIEYECPNCGAIHHIEEVNED